MSSIEETPDIGEVTGDVTVDVDDGHVDVTTPCDTCGPFCVWLCVDDNAVKDRPGWVPLVNTKVIERRRKEIRERKKAAHEAAKNAPAPTLLQQMNAGGALTSQPTSTSISTTTPKL